MADAKVNSVHTRVVVFSGHMTDTAERAVARFPPDLEAAVSAAISDVLRSWDIGPGAVCLSGGARGGDILFTECCLERGAKVRWFLPLPKEEFIARSVQSPTGDWEQRFRSLMNRVEVNIPDEMPGYTATGSPFDELNDRLLAAAAAEAAPNRPMVLLLWDGQSGDGVGGTADVAAKIRDLAWPMTVVSPAAL